MNTTAPANDAADGAPVPCLHCGAPMRLGHSVGLHAAPELDCGYCGRKESLPAEAAQRHRHLQLRLLQLQRSRAALEAPLSSYRALSHGFVPVLVMLALAMGSQLYSHWRHPQWVLTWTSFIPVAACVGILTGWIAMTLTFKGLIQPLLLARPALHPGLPARCRVCGGDLPSLRAAHVACRYCKADNLTSARLGSQVSELLQRESDEYFARARGSHPDPNAFSKPARAFYVWGVVSALATLAISSAVLAAR